jgi:hypothetical protein
MTMSQMSTRVNTLKERNRNAVASVASVASICFGVLEMNWITGLIFFM